MLNDKSNSKPSTNTSNAPTKSNGSQSDTDISSITDTTDYSDDTNILVFAFNIMTNHPEAKDAAAATLRSLSQTWLLYHRLIIVIFSLFWIWFPILTPLLYLLRINFYNHSLLILLGLPPRKPRETLIPPHKPRERTSTYFTLYYHSPLFSVRIYDSVIDSSSMVLSEIRFSIQLCQPSVQLFNTIFAAS